MRKLLIIFAFILAVPVGVLAQTNSFDKLYDKYSGELGYVTLSITGFMLDMLEADNRFFSTEGAFANVKSIKVIAAGHEDAVFASEIGRLPDPDHNLLSDLNENGNRTMLYQRKRRKSSEYLVIVYGKSENMAIRILGDIDLKNIPDFQSKDK